MKAGRLRKRLTIEAPVTSRDAHGQNVPTYNAVTTVSAEIVPLRGQQLAIAQARTITATATHRITIRYRADLKIGFHRFRYGHVDGLSLATLTAGQLVELTAGELAALPAASPQRIYTI